MKINNCQEFQCPVERVKHAMWVGSVYLDVSGLGLTILVLWILAEPLRATEFTLWTVLAVSGSVARSWHSVVIDQ